ncbi:hypothetical protein [Paracoccus versutus]|uniref:hypothetical protein n=1 Tax=Paracoccus versutus TaxID=34007 RepID=UPI003C7C5892
MASVPPSGDRKADIPQDHPFARRQRHPFQGKTVSARDSGGLELLQKGNAADLGHPRHRGLHPPGEVPGGKDQPQGRGVQAKQQEQHQILRGGIAAKENRRTDRNQHLPVAAQPGIGQAHLPERRGSGVIPRLAHCRDRLLMGIEAALGTDKGADYRDSADQMARSFAQPGQGGIPATVILSWGAYRQWIEPQQQRE